MYTYYFKKEGSKHIVVNVKDGSTEHKGYAVSAEEIGDWSWKYQALPEEEMQKVDAAMTEDLFEGASGKDDAENDEAKDEANRGNY